MKLTPAHIDEIRRMVSGRILKDVPLRRFSSFRIGGPADLVVEPDTADQLADLWRYLLENSIPRLILGAGTNVLFHDAGFRGVVVLTGRLKTFQIYENGSEHSVIAAGAGLPLSVVIHRACRFGWTGLEPLWGIPGSFGGGIVANAGSGGVCLGDFLHEMRLLDETGKILVLEKTDLEYGYRSMKVPRASVVTEGKLRLCRGIPATIGAGLADAKTVRKRTQPRSQPSAGCVFKNPSQDNPAGAVIDRLGFKGMTVGGAQVSPVHANFIVNLGDASSSDVMELIAVIRDRVRQTKGLELELEIRIIGEHGTDE